MRKAVILLFSCVTFAAVLAAPSVRDTDEGHGSEKDIAFHNNDQHIQSVIVLNRLSSLHTRNFFEDVISSQLGMTPKEFLEKIDDTFRRVNSITQGGVSELDSLLNSATPEVRAKIIQLRDNSIKKILEVGQKFLEDLGLVLPAITYNHIQGSVADMVYALLRKTLEEFVRSVLRAMDDSLQIFIETIDAFTALSNEARPEVGQALTRISNDYWYQSLRILQPMIDQLRSVTDFRRFGVFHQDQDLLHAAVSSILGIDIETAALETNLALLQLTASVQATRDALYDVVSTSADNKVQTKVMAIFDSAVTDVIRDVKPISTSLLEFQGNDRRDNSFAFNLVTSLLGVGATDFKAYLRWAAPHISTKVTEAASNILSASVEGGNETAAKTWEVLRNGIDSGKDAIENLVEVLKPLLTEDTKLIRSSPKKEEECEWADENGLAFNRDALIHSVSTILGFDVAFATKTLKISLEKLDDLMDASLEELNSLLNEEKKEMQTLKHEILEILSQSLTNIHITLQPMLDVMLPFLPDKIRVNKEIALDIYSAINGVSREGFIEYCKLVARRIPELTDAASAQIRATAAKGDEEIKVQIEALLEKNDNLTKQYISPFLNILKPVISSL